MARIGIYGGSFNPPHAGHILAAKELVRLLRLDRLYIVPAAEPPHKQLPEGSPTAEQRLRLCRLAFDGLENTEVSDMELTRSGKSYTVDTVKEFKREYPDDSLFLVMGTDMLLSFSGWYQPDEIAKCVTLAVMHRYEDDAALSQTVDTAISDLKSNLHAKVIQVRNHPIETSSTEVRRMIFLDCMQELLTEPVADEIRKTGAYRYGTDRKKLPFDDLMKTALPLHKPQRIPHVLGCCETAKELARKYGADTDSAARAGILHDVTKALGSRAQRLLCARYSLPLSDAELKNDKLLHAKTGAAVAEHIFGEDPEVCDAIYWHTTGKADMTVLEKILYIADYMEPNRDFDGVDHLRALVQTDLDAACLEGFRMSLEQLKRRGKIIDPNSLQAWQYLARERKQSE